MGRILIPAAVQSRLGLSAGMSLVVEEGDQGSVRLRIQSEPPQLVDKAGVLVVRAEPLSDLTDVTRHERNRRVSAASHSLTMLAPSRALAPIIGGWPFGFESLGMSGKEKW